MSGFEVVGVALAVLPLLVSVAEHYQTAYDKLKHWREFSKELGEFEGKLYCCQIVFRNNCLLLLASITSRAEAQRMLTYRQDARWSDPEIERKLIRHLDESFNSCVWLMGQIKDDLEFLHVKSQEIHDAVDKLVLVSAKIVLDNYPFLVSTNTTYSIATRNEYWKESMADHQSGNEVQRDRAVPHQ
jgi:hypothetical protein